MAKQDIAGIDYHDPRVIPAAHAMLDAKDPIFADRVRRVLAAADEADRAAGIHRIKQRTITTAAERAVLKPGTIAVDADGNAWKLGTGSWVSTGGDTPPLFDEDDYTLTILQEPSA